MRALAWVPGGSLPGGSPRTTLPPPLRTPTPAHNAAVPTSQQIPMITKTLPPFFRVKVFVIMKKPLFCLDEEGLAWAGRLAYLSPDPPATTSCSAPRRTVTQPDPPDPGPPTCSPARPCVQVATTMHGRRVRRVADEAGGEDGGACGVF